MTTHRDTLIARLLAALSHLSHENQVRVLCASFDTDKLEQVVSLHERCTAGVTFSEVLDREMVRLTGEPASRDRREGGPVKIRLTPTQRRALDLFDIDDMHAVRIALDENRTCIHLPEGCADGLFCELARAAQVAHEAAAKFASDAHLRAAARQACRALDSLARIVRLVDHERNRPAKRTSPPAPDRAQPTDTRKET